jgi:hypothetical protein
MIRPLLLSLVGVLSLSSCSSVGIHGLQNHTPWVKTAPTRILVEPFSAPLSNLQLGDRPAAEKRILRTEIVNSLAQNTAGQLRTHAANAAVLQNAGQIQPGTWLIRGDILEVDQGSRALRAVVGLGAGSTKMRTRVRVFSVTPQGLVPLITFKTTGKSGLEPGAALGLATGGVSTALGAANAAGSLLLSSLPGVSSDIDRTSYEIAAVLSAYLQRNGLLDRSRVAIAPRKKGEAPSTLNLNRAVPAPLRPQN